SGNPFPARSLSREAPWLRRAVARQARRSQARARSDPVDRLSGGASGTACANAVGDDGEAAARGGDAASRAEWPSPHVAAPARQHLGDTPAPAHRPYRVGMVDQALL